MKALCKSKKLEFEELKRDELIRSSNKPKKVCLLKGGNATPPVENHIKSSQWVEYFISVLFKDNEQPIAEMEVNSDEDGNVPIESDKLSSSVTI